MQDVLVALPLHPVAVLVVSRMFGVDIEVVGLRGMFCSRHPKMSIPPRSDTPLLIGKQALPIPDLYIPRAD